MSYLGNERGVHPRRDLWHDHFRWQGTRLFGRTAAGRAVVVGC